MVENIINNQIKTEDKAQNFFIKNKKFLIAGVVVICILLLVVMFSLLLSNSANTSRPGSNNNPNITQTPTNNPKTTKELRYNPLINNQEVEMIEDAYKKQLQKAGKPVPTEPDYKFQYELSPNLNSGNSFLPVQKVYAAGKCNTVTAPAKVTVYTLKNHINQKDAQKLADGFGLTGSPSSLPTDDPNSYQYYFTDEQTSKYFTITEPSVTYYFHQAIVSASGSATVDITQAEILANKALSDHNLVTGITLKNKNTDNNIHFFTYDRKYGEYTLVNNQAIEALGKTNSLCNLTPSIQMGVIDVQITDRGDLYKIINMTRQISTTNSLSSQSLVSSIKEYNNQPPINPIVIGGTANAKKEKVTIDEVSIVWYDYGEKFAQITYIPMYLTSGRTASGARVFSLFPTVSKKEIDKLPVSNKLNVSRNTLQLLPFYLNPRPLATKAPQAKKCYGGAIDYQVKCSVNGSLICAKVFEAPAQSDPMGVCQNGCQTKTEVIDFNNQNPCILIKSRLRNLNYYDPYPFSKSGTATCVLNGCPC